MEESETRGRDLSTTGPGCPSVESHHLRPSSASSSTSTEDIIHRPRTRDIVSESQLHGTTSAAVTETDGGSSTNGSETPIRPRKRTRIQKVGKRMLLKRRGQKEKNTYRLLQEKSFQHEKQDHHANIEENSTKRLQRVKGLTFCSSSMA